MTWWKLLLFIRFRNYPVFVIHWLYSFSEEIVARHQQHRFPGFRFLLMSIPIWIDTTVFSFSQKYMFSCNKPNNVLAFSWFLVFRYFKYPFLHTMPDSCDLHALSIRLMNFYIIFYDLSFNLSIHTLPVQTFGTQRTNHRYIKYQCLVRQVPAVGTTENGVHYWVMKTVWLHKFIANTPNTNVRQASLHVANHISAGMRLFGLRVFLDNTVCLM